MLFDYFLIAFRNLKSRRTRTYLTMIGIIIGIAAIVSLVSLGQGLQVAINEEFEQMGSDKIIIQPGKSEGLSGSFTISDVIELTDKDLEVVKGVRGVKQGAGMIVGMTPMRVGDEVIYNWYAGVPTDETRTVIESMQSVEIIEGRELKPQDKARGLIGREFYEGRLFEDKVVIGNRIEINNVSFRVVGHFAPIGNPQDDATVWMPLEFAREIFNKGDTLDMVMAQVEEGEDPEEIATNIERSLRRSRGLKEGEEDFNVMTTSEMMESLDVILTTVQVVFIGIAAISLIVGGIGIMNSMYTSVLERTTEIGIMKSIGAQNKDIMMIFLVEAGLLGAAGGAIGIAIGVGLSKVVEIASTAALGTDLLRAYFPTYLVVGALIFSFVVGTLSGVLPARNASKMSPVDALRYE